MDALERTCLPGIVYGKKEGEELLLDLYLPERREGAAEEPIPAVLYMHGGGWVRGSRSGPSAVAFALEMSAEGIAVATVDYRMAPRHPAPAAIEDCALAVRWVRANAPNYGIDSGRIAAMGNSAGGHLASMLGLIRPEDAMHGTDLEEHSSSVCGVLNLCGITDVEVMIAGAEKKIWAEAWLPLSLENREELARRCSPVNYARADAPPFLILHGDADESVPYSQAEALANALGETGADCDFVTVSGGGHQLGVTGSVAVQRQIRNARRAFLAKIGHLAEPASVS